jgi:hypothetical protein
MCYLLIYQQIRYVRDEKEDEDKNNLNVLIDADP